MNPKIKKINAEFAKNAEKIEKLQIRQKDLIQQRTNLENSDILVLMHSYNLDITQLTALLRTMKETGADIIQEELEKVPHDET